LHQQGKLHQAEIIHAAIPKAQPDHVEALYYRGNVLTSLKRFEEALASGDEASRGWLDQSPGRAAAHRAAAATARRGMAGAAPMPVLSA
jgi:hypothetical protein